MKSPETLSRLRDQIDLRKLITAWDPVGLMACGCPEDEYDCLETEVLKRLRRGEGRKKLVEFLVCHFPRHFGVRVSKGKTREGVKQIVLWWENDAESTNLKP